MLRLAVLLAVVTAAFAWAGSAFGAGPTVLFTTTSHEVSQAQLEAALPAFQTAVSRDLAPAWGVDAMLTTDPAVRADMTVTVSDDPDCYDCLGYHTVAENRPQAFVFATLAADYHDDWRLVATHELFEMLVDPWINRFAVWHNRQYLVEVADQVEDGMYAYWIDGVPISDFILPSWFGGIKGKPVDFTHGLKRPGQVGRHGYCSYLNPDGTWGQRFA